MNLHNLQQISDFHVWQASQQPCQLPVSISNLRTGKRPDQQASEAVFSSTDVIPKSLNTTVSNLIKMFESGDFERLIVEAESALLDCPESSEISNILAGTLLTLGKWEKAFKAYQSYSQLQPRDELAYFNCGVALDNLDRHEEAIECYSEALSLNPEFDSALWNRALSKFSINRFEDALLDLSSLRKITSNHDTEYTERSFISASSGWSHGDSR
mgnify:CR=1 FL=1